MKEERGPPWLRLCYNGTMVSQYLDNKTENMNISKNQHNN